jgi:hypothetical protein
MNKHIFCIALGLAVVGCQQVEPSDPTVSESKSAELGTTSADLELPTAAELLALPPLSGSWEQIGDEATSLVLFTPTDYPQTLAIGCDGDTGQALILWTISSPADDSEVRVYTESQVVVFAATGFNDEAPVRAVQVDSTDLRLAALKERQTHFAVQSTGEAILLPWDASIATALTNCGT